MSGYSIQVIRGQGQFPFRCFVPDRFPAVPLLLAAYHRASGNRQGRSRWLWKEHLARPYRSLMIEFGRRHDRYEDVIMKETAKQTRNSLTLRCMNIVSANPTRLAEFYQDILGANIDPSRGGPHRIEMWFGDRDEQTVMIVVNHDGGFTPRTFNACQGFELHVPDANAEYKRVQALGVEAKEPPKDLPWGYRFFHIQDPDGNGIDIVQGL